MTYFRIAGAHDFLLETALYRLVSPCTSVFHLFLPFCDLEHHLMQHIDLSLTRRYLVERNFGGDLLSVLVIFTDSKHGLFFRSVQYQLRALLGTVGISVTADD